MSVENNKNPLKVLIVDDDPVTRMLLRAALTQWDYDIEEAENGEDAWHILTNKNPPQIIILDWMMPKLDGLSLCTQIKKELSPHPYIILLTSISGTANIIKALDAGADEFLSKPFNHAELRSRMLAGKRILDYKKNHLQQSLQLKRCMGEIDLISRQLKRNIDKLRKNSARF